MDRRLKNAIIRLGIPAVIFFGWMYYCIWGMSEKPNVDNVIMYFLPAALVMHVYMEVVELD